MIEYKLVPIGDMNHAVTEGRPLLNSNEKTVNEEISLTDRKPISGGSDIKDYIFKILTDNTINKKLKMKLFKGVMRKQHDKKENELKMNTLDQQTDDSLFEIVKLNLNISHIPEAYKFYLYLKKRSDITWDDHGVLFINGNKTHLDLFKFFKLLFSSRSQIKDDNDKKILKRILYQASDMLPHIKNIHIKDILLNDQIDNQLSSDNDDDSDDIFTDASYTISSPAPTKMSLRPKKRGHGKQKYWETW